MIKYELIVGQLLLENVVNKNQIFEPQKLSIQQLLWTHTKDYLDRLSNLPLPRKEERMIGFPVQESLVHRGRVISHGTLECAQYALTHGVALNVAGGTHHAYADHGEGFCVFNDFAITANCLLKQREVKSILIIDLDVHQGNGTAHIFKNEPRVFTFSMHGAKNYPLRKEQSDWDIELKDKIGGKEYLNILNKALKELKKKVQPDLILYLSGVDVLTTDKLGRLDLSLQSCMERDLIVFNYCLENQIPVAVSMGGGYSPNIKDIVAAHTNTFKAAADIFG